MNNNNNRLSLSSDDDDDDSGDGDDINIIEKEDDDDDSSHVSASLPPQHKLEDFDEANLSHHLMQYVLLKNCYQSQLFLTYDAVLKVFFVKKIFWQLFNASISQRFLHKLRGLLNIMDVTIFHEVARTLFNAMCFAYDALETAKTALEEVNTRYYSQP